MVLGINVDIVHPQADLSAYKLVILPCLPIVPDALVYSLKNFDGAVVVGPRSGSRTDDFSIPTELTPGSLQTLLPIKVVKSESLPPELEHGGDGWSSIVGSITLKVQWRPKWSQRMGR